MDERLAPQYSRRLPDGRVSRWQRRPACGVWKHLNCAATKAVAELAAGDCTDGDKAGGELY